MRSGPRRSGGRLRPGNEALGRSRGTGSKLIPRIEVGSDSGMASFRHASGHDSRECGIVESELADVHERQDVRPVLLDGGRDGCRAAWSLRAIKPEMDARGGGQDVPPGGDRRAKKTSASTSIRSMAGSGQSRWARVGRKLSFGAEGWVAQGGGGVFRHWTGRGRGE